MMFYKRGVSTGGQINLGLSTDAYYISGGSSAAGFTPSIPYIYKDSTGKVQARFT
jgi:hypothetical protein